MPASSSKRAKRGRAEASEAQPDAGEDAEEAERAAPKRRKSKDRAATRSAYWEPAVAAGAKRARRESSQSAGTKQSGARTARRQRALPADAAPAPAPRDAIGVLAPHRRNRRRPAGRERGRREAAAGHGKRRAGGERGGGGGGGAGAGAPGPAEQPPAAIGPRTRGRSRRAAASPQPSPGGARESQPPVKPSHVNPACAGSGSAGGAAELEEAGVRGRRRGGPGPPPPLPPFDPPSVPASPMLRRAPAPAPPARPSERIWRDPYKTLVAALLLNRTRGAQVRAVVWALFERWPTAAALATADEARSPLSCPSRHPLGLYNKRARTLVRFAREFLTLPWTAPSQLHGVGKYAEDSWRIFCRGEWREARPEDHMLTHYHRWLWETRGGGGQPGASDRRGRRSRAGGGRGYESGA
eukprot:tig00000940_g5553.t1